LSKYERKKQSSNARPAYLLSSRGDYFTGEGDEKGKVMGIFRSLGALSRAIGPTVACAGIYVFH